MASTKSDNKVPQLTDFHQVCVLSNGQPGSFLFVSAALRYLFEQLKIEKNHNVEYTEFVCKGTNFTYPTPHKEASAAIKSANKTGSESKTKYSADMLLRQQLMTWLLGRGATVKIGATNGRDKSADFVKYFMQCLLQAQGPILLVMTSYWLPFEALLKKLPAAAQLKAKKFLVVHAYGSNNLNRVLPYRKKAAGEKKDTKDNTEERTKAHRVLIKKIKGSCKQLFLTEAYHLRGDEPTMTKQNSPLTVRVLQEAATHDVGYYMLRSLSIAQANAMFARHAPNVQKIWQKALGACEHMLPNDRKIFKQSLEELHDIIFPGHGGEQKAVNSAKKCEKVAESGVFLALNTITSAVAAKQPDADQLSRKVIHRISAITGVIERFYRSQPGLFKECDMKKFSRQSLALHTFNDFNPSYTELFTLISLLAPGRYAPIELKMRRRGNAIYDYKKSAGTGNLYGFLGYTRLTPSQAKAKPKLSQSQASVAKAVTAVSSASSTVSTAGSSTSASSGSSISKTASSVTRTADLMEYMDYMLAAILFRHPKVVINDGMREVLLKDPSFVKQYKMVEHKLTNDYYTPLGIPFPFDIVPFISTFYAKKAISPVPRPLASAYSEATTSAAASERDQEVVRVGEFTIDPPSRPGSPQTAAAQKKS